MASLVRTDSDLKTGIIAFLDARRRGILTEDGEPIVDLIDATSIELSRDGSNRS